MNLTSNWKITFGPGTTNRVLVDYADEIDAEPSWPLRRGLSVVNLIDADSPFLQATGNNVVVFSMRVYTDEALDATARQRVMESLISVVGYPKRPLKIEIAGITDRYWQFANSFISEHTPRRYMEAGTARVERAWSVTATGLVQVGP